MKEQTGKRLCDMRQLRAGGSVASAAPLCFRRRVAGQKWEKLPCQELSANTDAARRRLDLEC
jgi:hypothetical protein